MSCKQHLIPALFIVVISFGIYANALQNGFVYDDFLTIANNRFIRDRGNVSKLFTQDYFMLSGEGSYRPVVTATYFLDYVFFGLNPKGFHLTNIIIHSINGISLHILLALTIRRNDNHTAPLQRLPFIISVIFVTHPVLTEAVNAISFREDLLVFLFYTVTLSLYIALRSTATGTMRTALYLISCATYAIALLSKEMAVTLPLIIYCYEKIRGDMRHKTISLNPYNAGYIVITLGYAYLRFYYFSHPVEEDVVPWTLAERVLTLPWIMVYNIRMLIFPVSLSADYVISPVASLFSIHFISSLAVVTVLLFLAFTIRKKESEASFGIFFFFIALLPVCNIVPVVSPLAERYLYLPALGFVLAVVGSINLVFKKPERRGFEIYGIVVLMVILSMHSYTVVKRNATWRDSYSLWSDTVRKMPDSFRAHNNLGYIFYRQGRLDQATKHFGRAIAANPLYVKAYMNLGTTYYEMKRPDEAVLQFETVVKLRPDNHNALNNLGVIYAGQGRIVEAIYRFQSAVRLKPDDPRYHSNLGDVYTRIGRIDEAVNELRSAVILDPRNPTAHYRLGVAYLKNGLKEMAKAELEIALRLKPDFSEARKTLESI